MFRQEAWCLTQADTVYKRCATPPVKSYVLHELAAKLEARGVAVEFSSNFAPDVDWAILALASVDPGHRIFEPLYVPIGRESRNGFTFEGSMPTTIMEAVRRNKVQKTKGKINLAAASVAPAQKRIEKLARRKEKLDRMYSLEQARLMKAMTDFHLRSDQSKRSDSPMKSDGQIKTRLF